MHVLFGSGIRVRGEVNGFTQTLVGSAVSEDEARTRIKGGRKEKNERKIKDESKCENKEEEKMEEILKQSW